MKIKLLAGLILSLQIILAGEVLPIEIPLNGEAAERSLEMSGLAWYGDYLILMPQYVNKEAPRFYALHKSQINKWLGGDRKDALTPEKIDLILPDYDASIGGYQGFEALCFSGNKVYLVMESKHDGVMHSYLVSGKMDFNNRNLTIDGNKLETIPLPVNIKNMGFESILKYKYRLMILFEANGANVYPNATAEFYTTSLKHKASVKFPNIEYRVTDVTGVDSRGRFWALNYFWPGEKKRLLPGEDGILDGYEKGVTHKQYEHVERLVEYKINSKEIVRTDSAPIQLVMEEKSRNWEGLARLGKKGFLMIVDEHPRTILAFVPFPPN
ncbi:MAG: hypothetical protein QF842_00705 [Candidatus Marinimicrobia bacterium]|nr:hypothetical protein [Candidatus Neomarinimicrobiota bacterium]